MPIREFYHLMHVVDDFDEAESRYGAVFSPRTYGPKHWSNLEKRWASLAVIGDDFVLELMEPSRAEADQAAPIPKFHQRFGQHLHSFSWLVDEADMRDLFDRLRAGGVRIAKSGGGVFPDGPIDELPQVFFTHPKDTFGQLEFMSLPPGESRNDPRLEPGWSSAYWRDSHPLQLLRTSHLTTAVRDLARARRLYEDLLGGRTFSERSDDAASSAFVLVGLNTVIELAMPATSESRLGRDLNLNGELPHAMTFVVADPDAAERHVEKVGLRIAERAGDRFMIEPADFFGAVVSFAAAGVPGDPRI